MNDTRCCRPTTGTGIPVPAPVPPCALAAVAAGRGMSGGVLVASGCYRYGVARGRSGYYISPGTVPVGDRRGDHRIILFFIFYHRMRRNDAVPHADAAASALSRAPGTRSQLQHKPRHVGSFDELQDKDEAAAVWEADKTASASRPDLMVRGWKIEWRPRLGGNGKEGNLYVWQPGSHTSSSEQPMESKMT